MTKVQSSNIDSIGYDANTKTLKVLFKPNSLYHYLNVSEETYQKLMASKSKGQALRTLVFPNVKFERIS